MRRLRIPFVGPTYRARSINQSAQRLVNLYLEATERGGKTQYALYPTPGLVLFDEVGIGPIREAIKVKQDTGYVVSRNEVYRIRESGADLTGTISTDDGPVGLAWNGQQLLIVDGVDGYVVTYATNALARITDPDFPAGVTWAQYVDKYFIVGGDGSERFYISDLGNGSSWVGTEFASAEGDPDPLIAGIVDHREVFLFGTNSFEIWTNTGNQDFPFERTPNAFGETGCAAAATVRKADNTVFWLGQDSRGDGTVWRMNGYEPARISTHAIEWAMRHYPKISDATAYTFQTDGHAWYVLHFPSADATWVYDATTNEWHEWLAYDDKAGTFHRHRSSCHFMLGRKHIVGDFESGKLYALDPDTYTDDGATIKRLRTTLAEDANLARVFYASLQIDMQTGVGMATGQGANPQMMLRWSDDGGHTWSSTRKATMGRIGEYGARCKWERLGSARARVWEISITDPVPVAILGAVLLADIGQS